MKLADGSSKIENILLTKVNVILQNRTIPTTFVIIPGAENRTLLGVDFIIDAGIQLNVAGRTWKFCDDVYDHYTLEFEAEASANDLYITSFEILRPEEGPMLD